MDLGLDGKIAFVAGASLGLGRAAALELSREGARVAICSRNQNAIDEAARAIQQETGNEVLGLVADVTDQSEVDAAITATVEHWGALHILVTNAGGARSGRFDALDDDDWRGGWELNFYSNVRLIRAALPHLRAAGWGRIIPITSISVKQPIDDLLLSNSVRPGVIGLVRSLATQLGPEGITVNSVAPGYTRTERVRHIFEDRAEERGVSVAEAMKVIDEQTAVGRMAEPAEQAAVIAFLASERASFITGQTILVDGGQYRGIM